MALSKLETLKNEILANNRTANTTENTSIAITDTISTTEDLRV